jgi:hypothetical protein
MFAVRHNCLRRSAFDSCVCVRVCVIAPHASLFVALPTCLLLYPAIQTLKATHCIVKEVEDEVRFECLVLLHFFMLIFAAADDYNFLQHNFQV